MNEENKNAYSEVIEILKWLDDEKKLEALPMEMLELLKSKVNPEYKPEISKEIPLDEQNLQPETYAILNWIAQKYWNDEVIKTEQIFKEEDIDNIHPIDNLVEEKIEENKGLESNNTELEEEENIKTNLPVLLDNLKWYEKIKIRIIEFFKKIFKKEKANRIQEGSNIWDPF